MVGLVMPVWCAGCAEAGVSLCRRCARELSHWFRAESDADALPPGIPVWAAAAYANHAARVVMAWKSGHRPDLHAPIHRLGRRLGTLFGVAAPAGPNIAVVPAPSGWRRRLRGNEVVQPFAQAIAEGLCTAGHRARMVPALTRAGGGRHHLSLAQRRVERAAAVTIRPRAMAQVRGFGRVRVLLVDDVLTTGATLAASAAAARGIGPVFGAIVLAVTPKPVHQRLPAQPWAGDLWAKE